VGVPVVAKPSHDPGFSRYTSNLNSLPSARCDFLLTKKYKRDLLEKEKADN
jgi:hypothetical protein